MGSEERLLKAAIKRGVPKDQLQNFLERLYVPTPKQLEFHAACRLADAEDGPSKIGFGGRRGPGKSHAAFAQAVLDDCQRFPGLKVLYLRKVGKAAKESFEDLRISVLPALKHTYLSHRGLLRLPNGSRVITGHFNAEKDIDAYLGVEYDEIRGLLRMDDSVLGPYEIDDVDYRECQQCGEKYLTAPVTKEIENRIKNNKWKKTMPVPVDVFS